MFDDLQPDPPKFKLSPSLVVQAIAWIVAALLTYGAVTNRLTAVETRQGEAERRMGDSDRRMERIENKLDRILERLK